MFYSTIIIGLILDFITKYLAVIYLKKPVLIAGDYIYLQLIYNPGIAFGMRLPFWFLKILTIILIIGIYYYYKSELKQENNIKKQNLLHISFGLILAGAIGNGIERIFDEKVIDFVGVQNFSVFNLADSFISIGAIFLIYYYYNKK